MEQVKENKEQEQEHTLVKVLRGMRYDLSSLQIKVTEALNMLASLELPDESRAVCPNCALTFKGPIGLAEHAYLQHSGPVPAHWLEAEARTELDAAARQPAKEHA